MGDKTRIANTMTLDSHSLGKHALSAGDCLLFSATDRRFEVLRLP